MYREPGRVDEDPAKARHERRQRFARKAKQERVLKLVAAIVVVAVIVAYMLKADPTGICRLSPKPGGQCSFSNPSLFPVLSICGRVVLTARYSSPHAPSRSEPVCSGFLWPLSTTNVSFSDMDPDPFTACDGSVEDNCVMTMERE
jgi:hypothetical protein